MARPHVTLKLATSLDGRIATSSGESRWISGQVSRAQVQVMRAAAHAVMIGAGTARADDPELLARTEPPPPRRPLRVVLDTEFSLPLGGRLFASLDQAPLVLSGLRCVSLAPISGKATSEPRKREPCSLELFPRWGRSRRLSARAA